MFIPVLEVLISTIEIALTHGKTALIDEEDYERVIQYHWRAYEHSTRCGLWYAKMNVRRADGKQRQTTLHPHQFIMRVHPGQ